jgi:anti-sigma regulatory factor (Ser/Thr protein kinase)
MIVEVRDASQVGDARRTATDLARRQGFDESAAGRVALVTTELATNLVKHGGGGRVIADVFDDADGAGVEVLALDKGPGMADVQRCFEDGYSTAGSPGTGLGAVSRVADRCAIFSRPGVGSAIMARCRAKRRRKPTKPRCEIGAVRAPYPGEIECGDAWLDHGGERGDTLLVVDGSGHGSLAAFAAEQALSVFRARPDQEVPTLATLMHAALAPTRGAAIAIARIDPLARVVRFVGIGNIAGMLVAGGKVQRMVSHNGTAGHVAPRIQEFAYPYAGRPLVILHSDGIGTRWDLAAYPGLAAAHPSLIAGVLFRDHCRGRDDATVVALRGAA